MAPTVLKDIIIQLPMVGALMALVMFYENARSKERDRYLDLWTNHMTKSNESLAKAVTLLEIIEKRLPSS